MWRIIVTRLLQSVHTQKKTWDRLDLWKHIENVEKSDEKCKLNEYDWRIFLSKCVHLLMFSFFFVTIYSKIDARRMRSAYPIFYLKHSFTKENTFCCWFWFQLALKPISNQNECVISWDFMFFSAAVFLCQTQQFCATNISGDKVMHSTHIYIYVVDMDWLDNFDLALVAICRSHVVTLFSIVEFFSHWTHLHILCMKTFLSINFQK